MPSRTNLHANYRIVGIVVGSSTGHQFVPIAPLLPPSLVEFIKKVTNGCRVKEHWLNYLALTTIILEDYATLYAFKGDGY